MAAPLNSGSVNDDAELIIRKHLSPGLAQYEIGWSSLISAVAAGDDNVFATAALAAKQVFTSTASGTYLDRRAADDGITRPVSVGFSDDTFRHLVIKTTAKKVVTQAFLEILEVYYGTDSTRAHMAAAFVEPYALVDGDVLQVSIDGDLPINIPFSSSDFTDIGAASALEVSAVITRWLATNGSTAYALVFTDPVTGSNHPIIYSGALGLESSIQVTGGKAQNALFFPSALAASDVGKTWAVTKPRPGIARYTTVGATATDLNTVHAGDYVNIYGAAFNAANRGGFTVLVVDIRGSGGGLTQFFEVENLEAVAEAGVVVATEFDLVWFRPTKSTINDNGTRAVVVSQTSAGEVDVQLPATTIAVSRTVLTGAYLQPPIEFDITSLTRIGSDEITVGTSAAHGLSPGQQVIISGIEPSDTAPATVDGDGSSTTDASLVTIWSRVGASPGTAISFPESVALADGRGFITGGIDSLAVATDSALLFAVTGSTILGGGQTRYDYTWEAATPVPTPVVSHRMSVLVDDLQVGNVLLSGGRAGTPSTVPVAGNYYLGSVWGVGASDIWATGEHASGDDAAATLHWDGATWSEIPCGATGVSFLEDLWGAATDDVWAVGEEDSVGGIVFHWDGVNWSSVPGFSTFTGSTGNLISVWGFAANDIWIVGTSAVAVLTLHWDGATWTSVANGLGADSALCVWGAATNDVWVGLSSGNVIHWNGSVFSAPIATGLSGGVEDIWGNSAGDVWAVASGDTLIAHWNGAAWSTAASGVNDLRAVWGIAANDVWAVGATGNVIHWDGATWTVSADGGMFGTGVYGTAASDFWAVGSPGNIQHWDGATWSGAYDISVSTLVVTDAAYVFNLGAGTWSPPITMVSARRDHVQLTLADQRVLVAGGRDGAGDALAVAELFTSAANTFTATTGSMAFARYKFGAAQLDNGKVLVAGGFTDAGESIPTQTAELFDPATKTFSRASDMTYTRGGTVLTALGGNQFIAIGGYGRVSTQVGASNMATRACEIYDGNRGRWYPGPNLPFDMAVDEMTPQVTTLSDGRLVVSGGKGKAVYFDVAGRKWTPIRQALDGYRAASTQVLVVGDVDLVLLYGGTNDGGVTDLNTGELLVMASDAVADGGVNDVFTVVTTPSSTSLTLASPEHRSFTVNGGDSAVLTEFAAAPSPADIPGPYLLSPDSGPAITGVTTLLTQPVKSDSQYPTLHVTAGTALLFPDEPGWLVLSFGRDNQTFPIKYLGQAGPDELMLDYATAFPFDLSIGTDVTLLLNKSPFNPENAEPLGVLYVTDSAAGRIAAEASLDSVAAAGIELVKTIIYPGDRGLGAEGAATSGTGKLSDIVNVFGGDN